MTDGAAVALLATIPDGSRVVVKVLHVRDTTHVRTHRGLIVKKNDHWSIMTTSAGYPNGIVSVSPNVATQHGSEKRKPAHPPMDEKRLSKTRAV